MCIASAAFAAVASVKPVAVAPRPESEALARSRLMLERLDQLEADLHSEATAIDTYAVLQERHGEASQLACHVTDEHVNEMHRLLVAQLEKRREKEQERARKHKMRAMGRAAGKTLSMR
jgi:hypothetical protein